MISSKYFRFVYDDVVSSQFHMKCFQFFDEGPPKSRSFSRNNFAAFGFSGVVQIILRKDEMVRHFILSMNIFALLYPRVARFTTPQGYAKSDILNNDGK